MKKEKIAKYFLYFMMYAIIGWIYEVVLETFIYKWGFTNRGVLLDHIVQYMDLVH